MGCWGDVGVPGGVRDGGRYEMVGADCEKDGG